MDICADLGADHGGLTLDEIREIHEAGKVAYGEALYDLSQHVYLLASAAMAILDKEKQK